MKKFVCSVCGYVYEGEEAPEFCPVCKAPREKFNEVTGEMAWADEHRIGVATPSSRTAVFIRRRSHTRRSSIRATKYSSRRLLKKNAYTMKVLHGS